MSDKTSIFTNDIILSWLSYFSRETDVNLEKVKILDISKKKRNIIPTVESKRFVLILANEVHKNFFYDLWSAGLGDCTIWMKASVRPTNEGCTSEKLGDCINTEIDGPCVMLIRNDNARSVYKIGLDNDSFSNGPIRYVGHEIRTVIMGELHIDENDTICIISGESIAVEAAMIANEGTIIAVEYAKGDRETMEDNLSKFGLHNVEIVSDCEVATLKEHPAPSLAFIVATQNLENEIKNLLEINPKMQFVIYTLELDILSSIPELFKKYDIQDMEVVQIAVSKLNHKNVFETQPVPWLISGQA
ncbi:MAG: precorrin-6B methylase [Eubacterium sp.]|nr:precorrin-6B methylase [Eubacterium sp.]